MSQENVEIVRRGLAAQNRGDVDALLAMCAPDVVVDASRRLFDPDVYEGHNGVKAFLASLAEAWGDQQREIEDLVDAGDDVVVAIHLTSTGRGSGLTVEAHPAWVVSFRDGKACRWTVYQSRQEALEAMGLVE